MCAVEGSWVGSAVDTASIDTLVQHATNMKQNLAFRDSSDGGNSILHKAVTLVRRSMRLLCSLMRAGADVLATNDAGQTPAELARAEGKVLLAQLLDRAAQDRTERLKLENKEQVRAYEAGSPF